MAREYAENRIRQAIKLHKGNLVKVRQQIIAWTYEDAKLLHELARPHLPGIIGYAIDRVERIDEELAKAAEDEKKRAKESKTNPQPDININDLPEEAKDDGFGKDLLKAMAMGEPAIFGDEGATSRPMKKTLASRRHENTMRLIATEKSKKDLMPFKPEDTKGKGSSDR